MGAMTAKDRIEAAKAAKAAIEARLTPAMLAEIAERAEADRAEADLADLAAKERGLRLARDLDAAKEKFGEHLRAIDLEGREAGHGTWIIKPADKDIMSAFLRDAKQPNADSAAMNRRVAESCVVYWNGVEEDAIDGESMHALWDTFGAIPTTLGNAAVELGGFVAETRKSGR